MFGEIRNDISSLKVQSSKDDPGLIKKCGSEFEISRLTRQTLGDVIITSIKTIEGLHRFLLFVGYLIASGLTYLIDRERSFVYKVEALYNAYELIHIWAKAYFDDDHLIKNSQSQFVKSMNICKREDLEKKKDFDASERLKLVCCNMDVEDLRVCNINLEKDVPETAICNGICAGIQLDIAKNYVIDKKKIEEIVEDNENGASCEASANQAVYQLVKHLAVSDSEKFNVFCNHLSQISKSEGGDDLFHLDFDIIIEAFKLINDRFDNYQYTITKKNDIKDRLIPRSKDPIILIVQNLVEKQTDAIFKKKYFSVSEIESFENKVHQCINEQYEKERTSCEKLASSQKKMSIKKMKWLRSFLEMQYTYVATSSEMGSNISDPLIKESWIQIETDITNLHRFGYVAKARGLKLSPVLNIMGKSFMYDSDESYLKNISTLSEGVFSINFSTLDPFGGSARHTITYIKEKKSLEYILDPNGMQLKCKGSKDSIFHIQKLLTFYPEPLKQGSLYIAGKPNHQLRIFRIEQE